MSNLIAYLVVLVVFGAIDAVWITQVAVVHYREMLGDAMLEQVRVVPAVLFYLSFPVGIVVFAVHPGLQDQSVLKAIMLGLLFGGICYATYDLTNYATLKVWSPWITISDIVYGAVVSAISAVAAFYAVRAVRGGM